MEDLQAKLKQAQRDNNIVIVRMAKEIKDIEKQIADSEVTYSCGDRFKNSVGKKHILGFCGYIALFDLAECWFHNSDKDIHCDKCKISQENFDKIRGSEPFTRYWDARKKCKC